MASQIATLFAVLTDGQYTLGLEVGGKALEDPNGLLAVPYNLGSLRCHRPRDGSLQQILAAFTQG